MDEFKARVRKQQEEQHAVENHDVLMSAQHREMLDRERDARLRRDVPDEKRDKGERKRRASSSGSDSDSESSEGGRKRHKHRHKHDKEKKSKNKHSKRSRSARSTILPTSTIPFLVL